MDYITGKTIYGDGPTFTFAVQGECACGDENRKEVILLSLTPSASLPPTCTVAAATSGIPEADIRRAGVPSSWTR